MAITEIIKERCPCCRQSFIPGAHSEITCVHSYILRVLRIIKGMTIQQMRELPRLSSYSSQNLGRLVAKLHQENMICILGAKNKKAIWGLPWGMPSKTYMLNPETTLIEISQEPENKPIEPPQNQCEHDLWRKSLEIQRRHVHEMRGRC